MNASLRTSRARTPWTLAAAGALATLAAGIAPAQSAGERADGTNLAPIYTEGETDRYDMTVDADLKMTLLGSSQEIGSFIEARFVVEIVEASSEGATAIVRFDRIRVAFEGRPPLDGEFDSASKVADSPGDVPPLIVRPAIGKAITIKVDAWGAMISIDGLEDLAPEGVAGGLFLELFSDDALYSMLQPVFRIRPQQDDEPTSPARAMQAVGSSWNMSQPSVRSLGMRGQELTLTLESARGDEARIAITGKPNERLPDEAKGMPGVETTKSSVTGDAVWDTAGGELESLKSNATLSFGSSGSSFAIDIEITSKTTLERVD